MARQGARPSSRLAESFGPQPKKRSGGWNGPPNTLKVVGENSFEIHRNRSHSGRRETTDLASVSNILFDF